MADESQMVERQLSFSEVEAGASRRGLWLYVSTALHLVLLAWLVHSRPPIFVAPSSIAHGRNGSAVTTLYWTGSATAEAQPSARKHRLETARLTFPKDRQHERLAAKHNDATQSSDEDHHQQALAAGSPYGSLPGGPYSGHEVRPALPIISTDPAVLSSDLPDGLEGNVIVEITIDEAGNVTSKSVIQSLTPVIDGKVLAAVEKWRFRPATRDGVAVASKQDVYYHFPTSAQQQMAR